MLQHLEPPLPGHPYDAVVTLTATDPHGATAQVMVTFRVDYVCSVLQSATVNGATLRLTYSRPLVNTNTSEPAEGDFEVKVAGTAVSLAATDPVAVSTRAVTLTLAAAVSAGPAR